MKDSVFRPVVVGIGLVIVGILLYDLLQRGPDIDTFGLDPEDVASICGGDTIRVKKLVEYDLTRLGDSFTVQLPLGKVEVDNETAEAFLDRLLESDELGDRLREALLDAKHELQRARAAGGGKDKAR